MRRFFFDKVPVVGEEAVITGQDAKHISLVLRLKPGDEILLLTGDGLECTATIKSINSDGVKIAISSIRSALADPEVQLTVAIGFLKEKKMDELVRPLTELGMTRFQPFFAQRSVSRPDRDRMEKRVARWEKIARESLKQCRRGSVPDIRPAATFSETLSLVEGDDVKILFWECEDCGRSLSAVPPLLPDAKPGKPLRITVLLGPEGGLTVEEVDAARSAGFSVCSLGPRILRAETAAVASCAIIQYVYGDMGIKALKDEGRPLR